MQPTPEQRDAIYIDDKNLIVVAGAGSGKTRVLVERYLQRLAANPAWRLKSLVAITFTREAAYEMRHRLRGELERRASQPDGRAWARHLSQLDSARIDTIHGLCADLLRANAAQAGVDPLFAVLDENESAMLLDDVVDDALASLHAPLTRLYAHYDAFRIEDALRQLNLVNSERPPLPADPEALFQAWRRQWAELVFKARDRLLESPEALAVRRTIPPPKDKLGALYASYQDCLLEIEVGDDADAIQALLRDCHREGAVGNKGSAGAWGGKEYKQEAARLLRDARERIKSALEEAGDAPDEIDRATAQTLPLWDALLRQIQAEYRARKQESAQLDFDDLERLTAELLEDPAARDRYRGAEFKHLLVDEFQDTNATQWRIIRSLVDLERGGSLFVVGDPKQSIYQFRGADVSVFNTVQAQIANFAGRALPLSMSFRSHRPLIEQFNALFAEILVRDESSPARDYEVALDAPMSALRQEPPAMPAIELQLLDKVKRDDDGEALLDESGKQRYSALELRQWEAQAIAARVQDLVAARTPIHDKRHGKARALEYGDIAILFQSMSHVALYEEQLKAQEIPYLTIAGRGYFDRQEVWDMLELLRFLHNPADDLALATALRSPLFGFSDDALLALRLLRDERTGEPLRLWRALQEACDRPPPSLQQEERENLLFASNTLRELRRLAGRVTISELLRRALSATHYLAILTVLPDGARRRGNIDKLLQLAQDSGKITLGKFSQYLSDLSTRETREGEALLEASHALRLMTVHASKGLEFPLVILADAGWERGNRGAPTLLIDPRRGLSCQIFDAETNRYENGFAHRRSARLQNLREAAERKRLLYVAMTRAQDYLLLSGSASQDRKGAWTGSGWLRLLLPAMQVTDLPREEAQTVAFGGHDMRVLMPPAPPGIPRQFMDLSDESWQLAPASESPDWQPDLIKPVAAPKRSQPRHISVTQLDCLGAYQAGADPAEKRRFGMRFLQSALDSPPPAISDLSLEPNRQRARLLGEIAHEMLRYGKFSLEAASLEDMIRAVAWERGLTDPAALQPVLRDLRQLFEAYHGSQAHRWIESARAAGRPLYTELSFSLRAGERVIHGVMDVLLQRENGHWVIIDYKTSAVSLGNHARHARRYELQMGAYALALQTQLGLERPPRLFVHYLRGSQLVELPAERCLAALRAIDSAIHELAPAHA